MQPHWLGMFLGPLQRWNLPLERSQVTEACLNWLSKKGTFISGYTGVSRNPRTRTSTLVRTGTRTNTHSKQTSHVWFYEQKCVNLPQIEQGYESDLLGETGIKPCRPSSRSDRDTDRLGSQKNSSIICKNWTCDKESITNGENSSTNGANTIKKFTLFIHQSKFQSS